MPAECQQADKVDPITTQSVRTFQHVAVSDTPSPRDTGASDLAQPRSPHTGGTGNRDNSLWTEVQGTPVPGHLARPGMDSVHGVTLPEQQQRRTPKVSEVRGTSGHRHRAGFGHRSDQQPDCDRAQSKTQSEAHGQEHRHSFWHLFAGWGKRMGHGLRDVRASDYEPGANANDEGHGSSATATAEHGECNDPGHPLHREQGEHHEPHAGGGRGLVRDDWSDDVLTTMHHETSTVFQLVNEFSCELQQALRDTKPLGTRWVLGEVMCSPNSPLTHQVQQGGKSAFRHGLAQGDLSTQPGRMGLFQSVARHRPKHIWYSPVCGPWSSWSRLNSSRSLEHQKEYQLKRQELLYQFALGIALYRHQISQGDHFHWEQPQRSLMLKLPCLSEIHDHTQACEFDMCRAGNLMDPENGLAMKKGMTIITTFPPLYQRFHCMTCKHDHQHQPIEGSFRQKNGTCMLRSQFTEVYPRKFARAVAHVISKGEKWWPFRWKAGMTRSKFKACPQEPALVVSSRLRAKTSNVKSQFRQKPQFAKSELAQPVARESKVLQGSPRNTGLRQQSMHLFPPRRHPIHLLGNRFRNHPIQDSPNRDFGSNVCQSGNNKPY